MDPNIFGDYEYAFIETKEFSDAHKEAATTWGGHLASIHLESNTYIITKRTLELNMIYFFPGGQRISYNTTDGSDKAWKWSGGKIDTIIHGLPANLSLQHKMLIYFIRMVGTTLVLKIYIWWYL